MAMSLRSCCIIPIAASSISIAHTCSIRDIFVSLPAAASGHSWWPVRSPVTPATP